MIMQELCYKNRLNAIELQARNNKLKFAAESTVNVHL